MADVGHLTPPGHQQPSPRGPDDELACGCGNTTWGSTLTFSETPEGPVVSGDIRYGLEIPDA